MLRADETRRTPPYPAYATIVGVFAGSLAAAGGAAAASSRGRSPPPARTTSSRPRSRPWRARATSWSSVRP